ncbi:MULTISPECIES: DUF6527 family protein [Salipiger]|uniref:Uncharacterized protein n=1 Tax=Salipiger profundus TaxID=1229727 RepID=A0A1U7CZK0_9RHOB|nr:MULTISPECIES: DUF6527 family protein [Salipiger]ALF02065.1 hypothetical protein vBThpSP1_026 [Thiobacimonas phage vB_ThpS-P1]APX21288.1 hypothetical protein Ga0080559_TMP492 [Salipiger profundus]GGA03518.1 hypothetical protein GCM10011326_13630 [Salipiger profundus]
MIRAIYFSDRAKHRDTALPGSLWFSEPADGGVSAMWFYCPCGCGDLARITVGQEHKPHMTGPSWNWNGRTDAPTLSPSVHQLNCGWHGWLRSGYWESC